MQNKNNSKILPVKLSKLFEEFFNSEKTAGIILIFCTVLSLILANSGISADYIGFWKTDIAGNHLDHWVNDGLMTIFFLLIGLELEREIYIGELSNLKTALLPIFAAIGGMLVPAGIFTLLNYGTPTQAGAGIPMATDIAFAVGILSLLGNRVPATLKIFLMALAVIDDLGAILVIAIFYPSHAEPGLFGFSSGMNLMIAGAIFAILLILNRLKVYNLIPYLVLGVVMWYFMLHSGVHATITGVLVAFAIPFQDGKESSISYKLQNFLHKPISFAILPIFALANTAIVFNNIEFSSFLNTNDFGILLGLVVGKPLGIFLLCVLSVSLKITNKPDDLKWKHIAGAGFLGGIGFTMSIFITLLAFNDPLIIDMAKITIMTSSVIAATLGLIWLSLTLQKK